MVCVLLRVCECVCLILASACILLQLVSEQKGCCAPLELYGEDGDKLQEISGLFCSRNFSSHRADFKTIPRVCGPFFCALQLCRRKFLQIRHQFSATLKSAAAGRAAHDCKITFFADQISPSLQHVLEIGLQYLTNFLCSTSL